MSAIRHSLINLLRSNFRFLLLQYPISGRRLRRVAGGKKNTREKNKLTEFLRHPTVTLRSHSGAEFINKPAGVVNHSPEQFADQALEFYSGNEKEKIVSFVSIFGGHRQFYLPFQLSFFVYLSSIVSSFVSIRPFVAF